DEPNKAFQRSNGIEYHVDEDDDETEEMVAVQSPIQQSTLSATVNGTVDSPFKEPESINQIEVEEGVNMSGEKKIMQPSSEELIHVEDVTQVVEHPETTTNSLISSGGEEITSAVYDDPQTKEAALAEEQSASPVDTSMESEKADIVTFKDSEAKQDSTGAPEQVEDDSTPETEYASVDEVDDSELIETPQDENTNQQITTA